MGNRKNIVVTAYGHNSTLDKIAVSSFEVSESGYYAHKSSDADTYCDTINSLDLNGDAWIFAQVLPENTPYSLDAFVPLKLPRFQHLILKLDNRAIQKIMRELDSQELMKALHDQDETVKEKFFTNMSKRAVQMLKEDMEFTGPVKITDIKECQRKFLNIARRMEQTGEIIIPHFKGETAE